MIVNIMRITSMWGICAATVTGFIIWAYWYNHKGGGGLAV